MAKTRMSIQTQSVTCETCKITTTYEGEIPLKSEQIEMQRSQSDENGIYTYWHCPVCGIKKFIRKEHVA